MMMTISKRKTFHSACRIIWILVSLKVLVPTAGRPQLDSATLESGSATAGKNLCSTSCGGVSIPYPFNLGEEGCPGLPDYKLECKGRDVEGAGSSNSSSSVLVLSNGVSGDFQVLSISEDSLIVNATNIRAACCNCSTTATLMLDPGRPYAVSGENKFFVNGCNSRGYFGSDRSNGYILKCETGCDNPDPITDTYCNAFGCCSSPVPAGSRKIIFSGGGTAHNANSTNGASADSCGYSSIIYPKSYSTQNADVLGAGQYGMKLQWAIQVQQQKDGASGDSSSLMSTCEEVRSSAQYACSPAASCKYAVSVPGYNCICDKQGYTGDGYDLGSGCSDVNECEDPELNSCDKNAICTNTDGGYNCTCKELFAGDGQSKGSGCTFAGHHYNYEYTGSLSLAGAAGLNSTTSGRTSSQKACKPGSKSSDGDQECARSSKKEKKFVALIVGIISSTVLALVLGVKLVFWVHKLWGRRRCQPVDFYSANLSKLKSLSGEPARLFTYKELSKASNGFHPDLEIGTGGYGTVFKGTLPEGTLVAIKKTNNVSESGAEQFLNEVTILSQVNHRNLVKLLGCCLETDVPMIVYEFIPNGTLYDHLQAEDTKPLKWAQRMQIALETAGALTYLHSAAFPPIYHRDVKSTNILMEDDLTVKVTDFGLSRLVPKDVTHVSTVCIGTPGYMDPEYYHNYQLTDKSDVYSFGVVLMELITSLKPVDFTRSSQEINLATLSLVAIKSGRLLEIVDDTILTMFPPQGQAKCSRVLESIHSMAMLAVACLAPGREERPTMKDVMDELAKIKEDYDRMEEDQELESIKHKEYADTAGILGIGGTGAFFWDAFDSQIDSVDPPSSMDLIDLEGR